MSLFLPWQGEIGEPGLRGESGAPGSRASSAEHCSRQLHIHFSLLSIHQGNPGVAGEGGRPGKDGIPVRLP